MVNWLKESWKHYLGGIIGLIVFSALLIWLFSSSPAYDAFVNSLCFSGSDKGIIAWVRWSVCSVFFNYISCGFFYG